MKQVSMLYKRLNFNSSAESRFKMKASLKHSLRVVDEHNAIEKEANLQWDESRTDNNLVLINGKLKTFKNFSTDEREKFIDDCFAPTQPNNKKALIKNYSAYKIKLENAIEKETNGEAKAILQAVRNFPGDQEFDVSNFVAQLNAMNVVRKNQRITMIEKFADAHNSLLGSVDKKKTYIQEGLFKFPRPKNKEKAELTNELLPEDYIYHMRNFLSTNFADYDIKAIFAHLDEDKTHSHYFLSGVNNKTGDLDLHKREVEVVNNYIATLKDIDVEAELIPENKKLNHAERQRFGRYFQRFFYEFTNQHLLLAKGIEAVIANESERQSDIAIQRNIENNLPKNLRSHNFATLKVEQAEQELMAKKAKGNAIVKRVNEITAIKTEQLNDIKQQISVGKTEISTNEQIIIQLKHQNSALSIELKETQSSLINLNEAVTSQKNDILSINNELANKKTELKMTDALIKERIDDANAYITSINAQLNDKHAELHNIDSQITQAKSILAGFNDRVTQLVGSVIKNIYVRSVAVIKNHSAAADYVQKIMNDYAQIAPAFLRDICKTAANDVEDIEVIAKMKKKDNELDGDYER